jgi:hypothetical protein
VTGITERALRLASRGGGADIHRRTLSGASLWFQLALDYLRNEYLLEAGGPNLRRSNQDQTVEGTGVGDNEPHVASETKTPKVISVLVQVAGRIVDEDRVGL